MIESGIDLEMIFETVMGMVVSVGAYYAWRAKREATEANNAVNHSGDQPRLYDLALSNHEGVARIKERQSHMEKNLEEIKGDQKQHGEELRNHKSQLETHGAFLEQVWKKDLEDD
tara:strand:- start:5467 stop:5811 length:345 start_codon:yes stop_codon:yes gene_type:complete